MPSARPVDPGLDPGAASWLRDYFASSIANCGTGRPSA
jgi:hypothetical protein